LDPCAALEARLPLLLAPGGRLYLEAGRAFDAFGGLALLRSGRAGKAHFHLFAKPRP
jgi:hypothetical protein